MKPYNIILIAILSVVTSIAPAKEEPLMKLEDLFAVTASPKDWHIESVSIQKMNLCKVSISSIGDYRVTIKIRNISNHPIKMTTSNSFSFSLCPDQYTEKERLEYDKDYNKLCRRCHPTEDIMVAPNETYTGSGRNLSKYEGKKMIITAPGMTIGSYTLKQGTYTFKHNKMDNKSQ